MRPTDAETPGLGALLADTFAGEPTNTDLERLVRYAADPTALDPEERGQVEWELARSPLYAAQLRLLRRVDFDRLQGAGRPTPASVTPPRRSRARHLAWTAPAAAAILAAAFLGLRSFDPSPIDPDPSRAAPLDTARTDGVERNLTRADAPDRDALEMAAADPNATPPRAPEPVAPLPSASTPAASRTDASARDARRTTAAETHSPGTTATEGAPSGQDATRTAAQGRGTAQAPGAVQAGGTAQAPGAAQAIGTGPSQVELAEGPPTPDAARPPEPTRGTGPGASASQSTAVRRSDARPGPEPTEMELASLELPRYAAPPGALARPRRSATLRGPSTGLAPRALVPSHVGRTYRASPKLFWSVDAVPPAETEIEFAITTSTAIDPLVRRMLPVPRAAGLQSITLDPESERLPLGEECRWSVAIRTRSGGETREQLVSGFILRVPETDAPAAVLGAPQTATRSAELARAGLWYDALEAAVDLEERHPDHPRPAAALQRLLEETRR